MILGKVVFKSKFVIYFKIFYDEIKLIQSCMVVVIGWVFLIFVDIYVINKVIIYYVLGKLFLFLVINNFI